ncbi:MAG TPA: type II toxin-antitoxin system HicB family antitoxin [Fimbriimonas sp.]|nr:type II toxin-antitoxin system HicB family antitoxin [Fimbriimonas sp.]
MDLHLTIVYSQDEEGWWIAEIPEIPGAFSQGRTRDEAREMVLDAARELADTRRTAAMGVQHESVERLAVVV